MPRTLQIALSFFVATPIEVVEGVDFGGGRTSANKDTNCLIGWVLGRRASGHGPGPENLGLAGRLIIDYQPLGNVETSRSETLGPPASVRTSALGPQPTFLGSSECF